MLVSAFGLLLNGLDRLGVFLYHNHEDIKRLIDREKTASIKIQQLNKAYQTIVTRYSFNSYINHADIERDKIRDKLDQIKDKQIDVNKNLSTRIGVLEGEQKKCIG